MKLEPTAYDSDEERKKFRPANYNDLSEVDRLVIDDRLGLEPEKEKPHHKHHG